MNISNGKMGISAILPIYNCRERLERHLRGVQDWIHSVKEIIVVDSGSTDGSLELVYEVLVPLGAKVLQNPPGLYQSWNAGVAAASQQWLYFSTVEDPITLAGLQHLHEVITRHEADVAISPPAIMNHDGSEAGLEIMPSNRLAEVLLASGYQDQTLSKEETIAMLCGFIPSGLLGSSASNLYSTSFLQENPFPTDFSHCGDTAWGISVSPFVKIAFTPRCCARFLVQTTHVKVDPESQRIRFEKLADLARTSLQSHAVGDRRIAAMLGWFEFYDHWASTHLVWIRNLDRARLEMEEYINYFKNHVTFLQDHLTKRADVIGELSEALNQTREAVVQHELKIKELKGEVDGFYGLRGAWQCLKKAYITNFNRSPRAKNQL